MTRHGDNKPREEHDMATMEAPTLDRSEAETHDDEDAPYDVTAGVERILRATAMIRAAEQAFTEAVAEFDNAFERPGDFTVDLSVDARNDLQGRAKGLLADRCDHGDPGERLHRTAQELVDVVEFWRTRRTVQVRVSIDPTVRAKSLGNG